MKDGVIADYRITEQMLNYFIKKCMVQIIHPRPAHCDLRYPPHPPWLTVAPFVNQP